MSLWHRIRHGHWPVWVRWEDDAYDEEWCDRCDHRQPAMSDEARSDRAGAGG